MKDMEIYDKSGRALQQIDSVAQRVGHRVINGAEWVGSAAKTIFKVIAWGLFSIGAIVGAVVAWQVSRFAHSEAWTPRSSGTEHAWYPPARSAPAVQRTEPIAQRPMAPTQRVVPAGCRLAYIKPDSSVTLRFAARVHGVALEELRRCNPGDSVSIPDRETGYYIWLIPKPPNGHAELAVPSKTYVMTEVVWGDSRTGPFGNAQLHYLRPLQQTKHNVPPGWNVR